MSSIDAVTERDLVEGRLWQLHPEALDRWAGCRASFRFLAYKGKELVIYDFNDNKPVIKNTLTCVDVSLSFSKGIESVWLDSNNKSYTLSTVPVEVAEQLFLWHTYRSDVQYTPYNQVYSLRFSMLLRSRHNPAQKTPGFNYVLEKAAFNAAFQL